MYIILHHREDMKLLSRYITLDNRGPVLFTQVTHYANSIASAQQFNENPVLHFQFFIENKKNINSAH